ncbi:MAG: hypothetical protein SGI90_06315 [Candidatus Eisenbacteria bacterium]|nr:hypothetical protein [Candidatus Eisenbacteria bacterium]
MLTVGHVLTTALLLTVPFLPAPARGTEPSRAAEPQRAADPCGPARALPAYAHNDYRNTRPREEALELGYLGIEADVFLVDGTFLLAHDRKDIRNDFGFEATYLWHLLDRVQRCARVLPDARPFLIAIEDKAPTVESRLAMASLLGRYRALLRPAQDHPIAEFILVDDSATPESIPEDLKRFVGFQWRVTSRNPAPPAASAANYRLLSLDFKKEVGWDGTGDPPPALRKLIPAVVAAAKCIPGCRVRVHNVPVRGRIWTYLLDAGVDLIGVTELSKGAGLLGG